MVDPLPPPSPDTAAPAPDAVVVLPADPIAAGTLSRTAAPDVRSGALLPALQPLAEAARAYAARRDSPNTLRAYAADWRLFERWCLRQGLDLLVPDPRIVGLFLAAAADGHGLPQVSVAALERRLAALTTRYRSAGM